MGRNQQIDRENALDAAEAIVRRDGSGSLSHGNLATEAKISKGGVQSCFGTKEGLLDALLERWLSKHQEAIEERRAETTDEGFLAVHIEECLSRDSSRAIHSGAMLAALSRPANKLEVVRGWYGDTLRANALFADGKDEEIVRWLAAEGLFLLTQLGFLAATNEEHDRISKMLRRDTKQKLRDSEVNGD